MTCEETIGAIALAAGSILLLMAILSPPLIMVHLHYRAKRRCRAALQIQYDQAVAALRRLVESQLNEGMIVAGEVWQLPADNIMAGIFFDLLEDLAKKLGKPVYFLNDGKITTSGVAENRLIKFRQDELLARICGEQGNYWTINLDLENREPEARVINLQEMMSAVLKLRHELVLTRS